MSTLVDPLSKTFTIADLPSNHRVSGYGKGEWADDDEYRLSIYLDERDVVVELCFG